MFVKQTTDLSLANAGYDPVTVFGSLAYKANGLM